MSAVRAFFVGLREVFTLDRAAARARTLDDAERTRRKQLIRATRDRWTAANKLADPVPAIILLRDALHFALRAASDVLEVDERALLERIAGPRVESSKIETVARLLVLHEPLELDDLRFAEAESIRLAFERCLHAVLGSVDTRSVVAVHVLRISRPLALVVLAAWLVVPYARTHWMVHDVALGKPVTSSPLRGESPSADHVTDGKTRGPFDIATISMEHAFVMVDLGTDYAIQRIRVVNRGDGWFDDILPIQLEISSDGSRFTTVARKDDHFDTWTVELGGRRARFVRLFKPDNGYIAINEIEVYAR